LTFGLPVPSARADQYGGNDTIVGTATGSFHIEKICDDWWIVTPAGHGMLVRSVNWDSLEISGNYTPCVVPGIHLDLTYWDGPFEPATQEARAQEMISDYDSQLNLQGTDGVFFTLGFEHWALYDDEVSNWGEIGNFGILTDQDNAYDGIEARVSTGTDARGYAIGGEPGDYGNLLGPLGSYFSNIFSRLRYCGGPPPSPLPPQVAISAPEDRQTVLGRSTSSPRPSMPRPSRACSSSSTAPRCRALLTACPGTPLRSRPVCTP
jgi:hypothetical protein